MKRRTLVAAAGILAIAGSIPLSALAAEKTIVVGVTAGPHAEIMEVVKRIAEKQGMKIRIVEFNDFVQPNAALVAGDLDINSFQHKPYMDQQNEDRGYKLASAAPTITFPLTYYTRKGYKTLADLPQGARVGIPNDPTNGGRALKVLESAGLIKVRPEAGVLATKNDITDNPKKLDFVEVEAAQLPRALDDVALAVINSNFALSANLNPVKDAIAIEAKDSPYANIVAIRAGDENRPELQKLKAVLATPELKKFLEDKYQGAVVPAF